jgi:hypothetical protein
MISLYPNQKQLIDSWLQRANDPNADRYAVFMSLWIAFNAYCYAAYGTAANKDRADLQIDKGLRGLKTDTEVSGKITLNQSPGNKTIDLRSTAQIKIKIRRKYSEDSIFSDFTKDESILRAYKKLQTDIIYSEQLRGFQEALKHGKHHYVINMTRIHDYELELVEDDDLNEECYKRLVSANIVVPLEDKHIGSLRHLKEVLYVVRCNVFHGSKSPGVPSDDRIVEAAVPVLRRLINIATPTAE